MLWRDACGRVVDNVRKPWFDKYMTDKPLLDQANQALQQRDTATAERLYRAVLANDPDNRLALSNLSALLCQKDRPVEAESLLRPALIRLPDFSDGFLNLGFSLQHQRRLRESAEAYRQSIALKPANIQAMNNLGAVLQDLGNFEDAIAIYRSALAINPRYIDALTNLATALENIQKHEESEAAARSAIEYDPASVNGWIALGIALKGLNKFAESEDAFLKALDLAPANHEGWNNYGILLKDQGRLEEAIVAYRKAITNAPNYAKAHNNLGNALRECRRLTEAIATLGHAIELNPHYAEAHMNMALTLLQAEEYPTGWQEYEWRWGANYMRPRHTDIPRWDGNPPQNGSVLIHCEQGLGDTIQFARFIPLIGSLNIPIIFEVQAQIRTLIGKLGGVKHVIGNGESFSDVSAQLPLMSLPLIMGLKGDNVPAPVAFYSPPSEDIVRWRHRIGGTGLKIGIAWQGNPNGKVDWGRSLPLAHLAQLSTLDGVRLISLQKHHGIEQLQQLPANHTVETLGDDYDSGPDAFLDCAAVMAGLDLVITTDSALAHLAGTLGIPTWVILRFVPDWRWGLEGDTTPWYPSVRLFRQDRLGDWQSALDKVVLALKALSPK